MGARGDTGPIGQKRRVKLIGPHLADRRGRQTQQHRLGDQVGSAMKPRMCRNHRPGIGFRFTLEPGRDQGVILIAGQIYNHPAISSLKQTTGPVRRDQTGPVQSQLPHPVKDPQTVNVDPAAMACRNHRQLCTQQFKCRSNRAHAMTSSTRPQAMAVSRSMVSPNSAM